MAAVAAAFFMFASPVLAEPPLKIGDVILVEELCLQDGHVEMVDALEEDFNEGSASNGEQSRVAEEWQRQVASGKCAELTPARWLKVTEITKGGMSIFGRIWELRLEGSRKVFAVIFESLQMPQKINQKPNEWAI